MSINVFFSYSTKITLSFLAYLPHYLYKSFCLKNWYHILMVSGWSCFPTGEASLWQTSKEPLPLADNPGIAYSLFIDISLFIGIVFTTPLLELFKSVAGMFHMV